MTTLMVPDVEEEPWPTLGPGVCAFIETLLVFGPGDLRGQRARLDAEKRALVYRMYEVFPQGMPTAGRRRFRRCSLSLRKGTAKTELAAWIAAAELHPEGPVRCDGFDSNGAPVGRGVNDPYIPMVAYTEEQTEDLAYAALYTMLSEGPLADDFDIGLERIMRINGDGKAVALASSPDARDGARTTFQHFDETHRFTLPRLKSAHQTMMANLPKRRLADPWALETTTAYSTGENSVAEDTMTYARQLAAGERTDARLFFFHRQASDDADLTTPAGLRAAVIEASGAGIAEWSDIDGIVEQFDDPTADVALLRRLWLNQPVSGGGKFFPAERWLELDRGAQLPVRGEAIALGFDGSRFGDATALIGTHIESGFQWALGIWAAPLSVKATETEPWQVDKEAVKREVEMAFERWNVLRMYCDPPEWTSEIAEWQGRWGDKVVVEWWTRRALQMAAALGSYRGAMIDGEVTHDGDPVFASHIANAVRKETNLRDDKGNLLYLVRKERSDSPFKIDAGVAGTLSWEARNDVIASGVELRTKGSVYEDRGLRKL